MEVMISLIVITFFSLSAFGAVQVASKWALQTAYQSEAYRLAQQKAEALIADPTLAASGNESITSATSTRFSKNTLAQFSYGSITASQRVIFTRNVTVASSSSSFTLLNVNVSYVFGRRTYNIQLPVARAN